ncbi:MAG: retroviral-like aspartic protease family protein [Planctomycetes bacterium]|nr:retroviral-like aspartic protease family protein [Planctomycetota bacterium]
MGRFFVDIEVTNHQDVIRAQDGTLPADKVRRARLRGLVDTGASELVLPAAVVSALGLPELRQVTVRYADNRRAARTKVGDVEVKLLDRSEVLSAIVEPDRTEAIVGAIVLEALDLVVNPKELKIEPRDPQGITAALGG